MIVTHHDRVELNLDSTTVREVVGGDLLVDGVGAHVGPYTYHDDKGRPFIEHVPASTLFEAASLESAAGSDVNIKHPAGLVTQDNYRDVTHGVWVSAWDAGGGHMGVRLRLKTADSKALIRGAADRGEPVELSPAYQVDVIRDGSKLVQTDRRYNAMALLGEGEARGGAGMRLQLDGPECAPAGARIQVARAPRLDSHRALTVHSRRGAKKMTHAKLTLDGKAYMVAEGKARALRSLKIDSANADQIETGRVTIEIEGEETSELVLPVSMIEMLLEGIGASSAPAAPAEPELESEVEQAEGLDADDDEKMDAKAVRKLIGQAMDKRDRERVHADALVASVRSDAARLLPAGYDYSVHWTQVALDAIAKASPDDTLVARKYSKRAVKGDSVATGGLLELLRSHASKVAPRVTLTPPTKLDGGGPNSAAPWEADTMPKVEAN